MLSFYNLINLETSRYLEHAPDAKHLSIMSLRASHKPYVFRSK